MEILSLRNLLSNELFFTFYNFATASLNYYLVYFTLPLTIVIHTL